MVVEFLKGGGFKQDKIDEIMPGLSGMTMREVALTIRLTQARDQATTLRGIMRTRKTCFAPTPGLSIVDPSQAVYIPDKHLHDFAVEQAPFFLGEDMDERLVPRGLMAFGQPGVGKFLAGNRMS